MFGSRDSVLGARVSIDPLEPTEPLDPTEPIKTKFLISSYVREKLGETLMGLQKVLEDIVKKGKQEASAIIREGNREKSPIIQEANKTVSELAEKKDLEVLEEIQQIRLRELSVAELESKKIILNAQNEILHRVYKRMLEKLEELPPILVYVYHHNGFYFVTSPILLIISVFFLLWRILRG